MRSSWQDKNHRKGPTGNVYRRVLQLREILESELTTPGDRVNISATVAAYEDGQLEIRPHLWTYWVGGVKKTNYMEKDNTRWLREVPNWKNEAGHGPSVWGDHVSMLRLISSNL